MTPGTGWLGEQLGLTKEKGVFLGGYWLADVNYLSTGGEKPHSFAYNNLLLVDLALNLDKLVNLPGAEFSVQFLQYNGQPVNQWAGSVQGYNSLDAGAPLNRSELYQFWWRQALFDEKLVFRIGKSLPTADFNNVIKAVETDKSAHMSIPSISGLLYTPIWINPTLLGVMPGYYNSEYGITASLAPNKHFYINYGIYDGNLANGTQTGLILSTPFNGYYFNIAEVGATWTLGDENKPGHIGVGGWLQKGTLMGVNVNNNYAPITQQGADGLYAFMSQRLWFQHPGEDGSGITSFMQLGINNAQTLPVNDFIGGGLTGFGLIPGRPSDSLGIGVAWSALNHNIFQARSETMIQAYYQAHLFGTVFLEPAVTYIPTPGAAPNLNSAVPFTLRLITLF
ncbi:carbohydrate porin [Candidatus Methylospira mobilis]|uniref:carbohydrate porin n=1 Tax=Candidatus Methylospira mobilis TaxID=1808979 RepID=UPI0028EE159D|nr:carbohydrate porin [Candidatus Methylospira mobilis]WNV04694.1 carbohydrate porin [Candidatus Methylospira mobilis]